MPLFRKNRDKNDLEWEQLGLLGATHPLQCSGAGALLTSGQTQFMGVYLDAGEVITNLTFLVTVAGAGQTLVKAGLYDTAGTRLAVSADVKAAFEAGGYVVAPLTAAYTVPASDYYYIAILGVGGTQPTVWRSISATGLGGAINSGHAIAQLEAAQTDLDATATLASTTAYFWAGWY